MTRIKFMPTAEILSTKINWKKVLLSSAIFLAGLHGSMLVSHITALARADIAYQRASRSCERLDKMMMRDFGHSWPQDCVTLEPL